MKMKELTIDQKLLLCELIDGYAYPRFLCQCDPSVDTEGILILKMRILIQTFFNMVTLNIVIFTKNQRCLMIDYTKDEKEYLEEYPDTVPQDKWYDIEFMKANVESLYDVDIQAMQNTGYPEESVKTSLSYIILEKLGYDFTSIHKFFNIFQTKYEKPS